MAVFQNYYFLYFLTCVFGHFALYNQEISYNIFKGSYMIHLKVYYLENIIPSGKLLGFLPLLIFRNGYIHG